MTMYEKKKISRYAELKNGEYIGNVVSVIGNVPFHPNVKNLNVLKEIKN